MQSNLSSYLGQFSIAGFRDGLTMIAATFIAGTLDYLFNIVSGRMLRPAEFGVLIAVIALLQIAVHLTNVIRNVTAHYTAEVSASANITGAVGQLFKRIWSWAWRWGLVAMVVMALASPLLARLLQLDSILPVLAAGFSLLLLFLRPVTDGTLQGLQRFGGLGSVQVLQALLRLLIAASLILLGLQAFGALLALPLASSVALILALLLLRPSLRNAGKGEKAQQLSLAYSVQTLAGLLAFALLVNMDAILVKAAFDPQTAGNYAPIVTLGKINAFISFAIALVLFPKATQRQMAGRDTKPILSIALLAVIIPGFILTGIYFMIPGDLIDFLFGQAYQDPGLILGLVGLATTFYGALYIWLSYGLSLERSAIVYVMVAIAIFQAVGFLFFHATLLSIATVMLVTSIIGNVAAAVSTRLVAVNKPIRYT